jgi:hypothetical protein
METVLKNHNTCAEVWIYSLIFYLKAIKMIGSRMISRSAEKCENERLPDHSGRIRNRVRNLSHILQSIMHTDGVRDWV